MRPAPTLSRRIQVALLVAAALGAVAFGYLGFPG